MDSIENTNDSTFYRNHRENFKNQYTFITVDGIHVHNFELIPNLSSTDTFGLDKFVRSKVENLYKTYGPQFDIQASFGKVVRHTKTGLL